LSQLTPHPHDVSELLEPALSDIVQALSDRPGQTSAEYQAKAEDIWILIESFQPRDAVDLMLTGQLLAFNAAIADATRDLVRGAPDTIKQRTQSNLISMGRLTQGHLDRLAKRGSQPYRTEVASQQPAQPVAAASPAPPEPQTTPPVAETSWLDESQQEWVIETPAAVAAKQQGARTAAVLALVEATNWAKGAAAARTAEAPGLELPSGGKAGPPAPTTAVAGD
jgi:hypothetical protein